MTRIVLTSLEAWLGGQLQIIGVPLFLTKTHVAAEQEALALSARGKLFTLMIVTAATQVE
uniref:Uncharacterized protein n=1 Tax=Hyaloperonospora arabidopsidis (strain Emoy2) TaxID=559515 RepID=M4C4D1_HYAAE